MGPNAGPNAGRASIGALGHPNTDDGKGLNVTLSQQDQKTHPGEWSQGQERPGSWFAGKFGGTLSSLLCVSGGGPPLEMRHQLTQRDGVDL